MDLFLPCLPFLFSSTGLCIWDLATGHSLRIYLGFGGVHLQIKSAFTPKVFAGGRD